MVEKLKPLRLSMEHVVDPTLLLTAEEWLEYTGNSCVSKNKENRRIVTYFLKKTELTAKTVKAVKDLTNNIVRAITLDVDPGKYVDEHLNDIGPSEFIREFYESDFIVTDSFHGVVFALIFRKPFLAVSHGYNINRIESLLSSIDSESRIITDENALSNVQILQDIANYNELERLISTSHRFIKKSFS
jgi:exopolysaccharide biosynthesis predicted pyruvyltransferase EpsI